VSSLQHSSIFVLGPRFGPRNAKRPFRDVFCVREVKGNLPRGPQVTVPPRRRRLSAERRQALELLASSPSGMTEVLLFAHGVTPHMLGRLLRSGLATIQREAIQSSDHTIEIGRITTTDAGRLVLETCIGQKLTRDQWMP
jgi:hypothetical protein